MIGVTIMLLAIVTSSPVWSVTFKNILINNIALDVLGVWFMHCHFERHLSWGMKVVFIVKDGERADEKMLPPPADMPSCGGQVSSPTPLVFGAILGKKRGEVE